MDGNSDNFFTSNYEKHATERKIDFSLPVSCYISIICMVRLLLSLGNMYDD